jgi:hypothetical protein
MNHEASLCDTFKDLAALTWRRMGQADSMGFFWSEETNTETLLLTLAERHPTRVIVESVTKEREALIGADWEWWLGEPGNWMGMRVQAKRLKLPHERFDRIFSQKARKQPNTQMNTLIRRAHEDGVTPAYCFYVHSKRWPLVGYWPERHMIEGEGTPLGCLIAHASAVRVGRSTTLPNVAKVSSPWHHLVCEAGQEPSCLADRVHMVMRQSLWASGTSSRLSAGEDNPDWPLFNPVRELPPHVRVLAHRAAGTLGSEDKEPLFAAALERGLAGVALFSADPIDQTALG